MQSKLRKPTLRIFAVISASLITVLLIIVGTAIFYRPKPSLPDTSDWQTGMVFFSVGDSWESAAVRSLSSILNLAVSDSTPSHCGIVVMGKNGPLLVHASTVAKHIVMETPEEYIRKNGSYCLYVKTKPLLPDTLKLKADIDSLLKIPVPFDFEFNHDDPTALYCSELVITLHELNGSASLSSLKEKNWIYPQDILNILNQKK